ncbi:MAG: DNA recombination protein RmuC, partial [Methyloversatilis sp.]|nr:DNA recombination protein RmuC [Methyloversatilis sp.]
GVLSAIWLRSRNELVAERAQAERAAQLLMAQERLRAASLDIDRLRAELKVSGADRATLDLQLQQEKAARVRAETQAQRLPALEQTLADSRLAHDRALAEGAAQRQALAEAVAGLRTQLDAERSQTTQKLALLDAAREQMALQFQEVANRILEEKSQRFTQQNHDNLGLLLNPLNEKIKAFQDQVAQTYDRESKERLTLKNEIERLALLNTRISEDAVSLTQALKGSNKSQGIWGEMVLEKVLESSGLRRGHEYVAEESYAADDGNRRRPDVVIQLPEGRHMIIDAKMSLLGYERYCSADNDAARALAQREHVQSIRAHIKGLSDKNYPMLDGLKAPDFVLMFVPVEPAFMLAATSDNTLF